jgi:hypothetical protein
MNPKVHDAANKIIVWAEEIKAKRLQDLAEQSRKYPSNFKFYYPSVSGELEGSYILGAYLSGFADDDIQVWYRCHVPSWTPEDHEVMPLSESAIDRAIAKFGTPEQEV